MPVSKANRRRLTWPPTEITRAQTPLSTSFPAQDQQNTIGADAHRVRCQCSSICSDEYAGLRRDLDRTIQAANSVTQGKETV